MPLQGVQGDKVRGSEGAFGRPLLPAARFARRKEDGWPFGLGDREPPKEEKRLGPNRLHSRRTRTSTNRAIDLSILQNIPGPFQVIRFNRRRDRGPPKERIFKDLLDRISHLRILWRFTRINQGNKIPMEGQNIPPKGGENPQKSQTSK